MVIKKLSNLCCLWSKMTAIGNGKGIKKKTCRYFCVFNIQIGINVWKSAQQLRAD